METLVETEENEIKLVATEVTQAKMLASLRGKKDEELQGILRVLKAALHLAEFDISQEKVENIFDEYYDTHDLALFGFHASLRVRREGTNLSVTAKKLKGQERGQFSRSEHSQTLSEAQYAEYIRDGFRQIVELVFLDVVGKPLSLVLRVNNERRSFSLRRGNELYELALDLASFTNPKTGKMSDTQIEVEIEALNDAAKSKLGGIRRNLVDIVKTFDYSKESKYERGIKFFGLDKSRPQQWLKRLIEWWNSDIGLARLGIIVAVVGIAISIILALASIK
ncbi:hypothetical protein ANAEL_03568 [Anaerolineales bacterium]|nr:hypothetical protein ANAEL_03568 [Anaerolineales bacterium]